MKNIIAGLLAGMLLLGPFAAVGEARCQVTGEELTVGARGAVVIEAATGMVLFEQDAHEQLPMASTTKIMTALLTLEQEDIDSVFEVDSEAIRVEGSSMGLQEGDQVTLRALAGGMLMSSGNDGAQAAAVEISGSIPAFAQLMNRRAAEIGMANTSFVTPSGLDDEQHYSTAYDMALLGREALQNPDFAEMCSSPRLSLSYGNPPYGRSLINHNRLVREYDGAIGIKTGFTKKSGRCLVSAVERNGVTLICVTLGCPDDWDTHKMLYERYFDLVAMEPAPVPDSITVPVVGGISGHTTLMTVGQLQLPAVSDSAPVVTYEIQAPQFLYAPQFAGTVVGKIIYYIDDRVVGELPLAVGVSVDQQPHKSFWEQLFG